MKNHLKIIFISVMALAPALSSAQTSGVPSAEEPSITVEDCLIKARENYPLYKNKKLIEEAVKIDLTKTDMSFIPNLKISGKATYQNETPSMNVPFYSIEINKDQYQLTAEISQPIFDAGNLWASKDMIRAQGKSEEKQLETQLYNIQQSVMNVYFGILLINEQLAQNDLLLEELNRNLATVENYAKNGVAQKSDLDQINVEILTALKNRDDMVTQRESYYDSLSQFIGENPRNYRVLMPDNIEKLREVESSPVFSTIGKDGYKKNYGALEELLQNRPEISYYEAKAMEIASSKKAAVAKGLPILDVFFQGGYGRPGLNFLKNGFSPYYTAGIRLNWNLTGLYTIGKEEDKIAVQKMKLATQKNEFLFNSQMSIEQNMRNIKSVQNQLEADTKIIALRKNIVRTSESKMRNGVMSVSDLLTDINKLDTARKEQSYRKIQLIMKIYELKQTLNLWN